MLFASLKTIPASFASVHRDLGSGALQPYQRYGSASADARSMRSKVNAGMFAGLGGGTQPARNCGCRQSQIFAGKSSTFVGRTFQTHVSRASAPRALIKMLIPNSSAPQPNCKRLDHLFVAG